MKRLLSTILTICMMVSLFAVPVMATETEGEYAVATEVKYGSVTLNADTPYLHATENRNAPQGTIASANESESGYFLLAQFNATTGTLTYHNGYTLEQGAGKAEGALGYNHDTHFVLDGDTKYGIKADGSLTIDIGDYNNSLYIDWYIERLNVNIRGIDVAGDLTIKGGKGILQITGSAPLDENTGDSEVEYTSYALNALGDINLLGGTVYVYSRPYLQNGYGTDQATFVNAGGNINLGGATLKFRARKVDTYVNHFSNEPTITGYYKTQIFENLESDGSYGLTVDNGAGYGNINNINYYPTAAPATEIYYCGQKLDENTPYLLVKVAKDGAREPLASATETVEGYVLLAEFDATNGSLTYKSGFDSALSWNTQMNMAQISEDSRFYGIYADGSLTINLGDFHQHLWITWTEPKTFGMDAIRVKGDLIINGDKGTLKCVANAANSTETISSYGINVDGRIELRGGTVDIYNSMNQGNVKTNLVTMIKGSEIILNGATLKLRGKTQMTWNVKLTEGTMVVPSSYTETVYKKRNITDSMGAYSIVDESSSWTNNNDVEYEPPAGYFIEVGNNNVKLGGANKYLHWTKAYNNKNEIDYANCIYEANDVYEGASAVYDSETKTLRILEDNFYLVDYAKNNSGAAIEAEAALTIDTNGKNFYVVSYYNGYGDAIYAKGDIKLTGKGSIHASIAGSMMSASGVSAAVHSDTKVIVDTKGHILTANDKVGADDPRGYVFNAPTVEFTENANVKMGNSVASWQGSGWDGVSYYPGRIFHLNVTSVVIPGEADAIVCNEMLADLWTGFGEPNNTAKTYTEDSIKNANYMSIATTDKTISVDSVTIADGNVKVILSKGCGLSADAENPAVCIIAAGYDASGVLIGSDVYSGTADGEEQTLTIGDADTVIVYLWNSTTGMQPIKKARIY